MSIKEETELLSQLISSLDEAFQNLEKSYLKKDIPEFEKSKKVILDLQIKLKEVLK